jgi:hypothetical protein
MAANAGLPELIGGPDLLLRLTNTTPCPMYDVGDRDLVLLSRDCHMVAEPDDGRR